ncbi:hypothetical protein DNTS_005570 [Danionella cerebrum]|uniref:IRG-type G domain-containing protein n=1 Tax=Danionella cerebrum TaxID=2873325 RepID=A0A553NJY3_9TELE|nr:hypothetical protein DNTS_005570 [Danionella translucida]
MEELDDFCMITPKDLEDIKDFIVNEDLSETIRNIEYHLKQQELVELNIAVTGESGSGKSTFVNAFRGVGDEEEGSAATGPVETTTELTAYVHPKYETVKVWDLPGIGTPNFKADEYLEQVEFKKFDFFIIIASGRFRECHTQLANEIRKMGKTFYFVRSTIDANVAAEQRKRNFDLKKTLDMIRKECLNKIGFENPDVFLISNFELGKFDWNLLQEKMENELQEHKRRVLLLALPNITKGINEQKKAALAKNIPKVAILAAFVATIPIPGLSVAVDLAIVQREIKVYYNTFGLDDPSLQMLCNRSGKTIDEFKSLMKSPLHGGINPASIQSLVDAGSLIVAESTVEYVVSCIPLLGTVVAGGMSYLTVSSMLRKALDDLAEDAVNVLQATF